MFIFVQIKHNCFAITVTRKQFGGDSQALLLRLAIGVTLLVKQTNLTSHNSTLLFDSSVTVTHKRFGGDTTCGNDTDTQTSLFVNNVHFRSNQTQLLRNNSHSQTIRRRYARAAAATCDADTDGGGGGSFNSRCVF
jgi:hypothetical protein